MSADGTPLPGVPEARVGGDGTVVLVACPAEGCGRMDDLWLMECAPGRTWVFVNGCGHWGYIARGEGDMP